MWRKLKLAPTRNGLSVDGVCVLISQADIEGALDFLNIPALALRAERRRSTAGARASRAANAMDEILGHLRQVEIHHVGDTFHVNAARRGCRSPQERGTHLVGSLSMRDCAGSASGCHECWWISLHPSRAFSPAGPRRAWCARKRGMSLFRPSACSATGRLCDPVPLHKRADRRARPV